MATLGSPYANTAYCASADNPTFSLYPHRDTMPASHHPIICLLGPTAIGKTELAFAIADSYPVHLISVDSAQIYRHMDIGTAKPSLDILEKYPHALINLIEPEENYSAAQFCTDLEQELRLAHAAGKIPLLVGGTMLYYLAYFEGLNDLPSSSPATRAQLEARLQAEGNHALYAELMAKDPQTAAKISPNDQQRLIRFLELIALTGRPPSELYQTQTTPQLNRPICAIGLNTERHTLHNRIAQRFEHMIAQGFIDEVAHLKARPTLTAVHPSMRSVGYRQIWQYLAGTCDKATAIENGIIATRQLAKRQITWMNNRLKNVLPLQIHDPCTTSTQTILEQIERFLP